MKKLTKQGLSDLAKTMPIVLKEELSMCIGCGDGSAENPYTQFEFNCFLDSGSWHGGYVEGLGYVLESVIKDGGWYTEADLKRGIGVGGTQEDMYRHGFDIGYKASRSGRTVEQIKAHLYAFGIAVISGGADGLTAGFDGSGSFAQMGVYDGLKLGREHYELYGY